MPPERLPSSFRDPAGQILVHQGTVYRQVNKLGQKDYDSLMTSGLYDDLVERRLLIPHTETKPALPDVSAHKWLKPRQLGFISYPYEWSFSQLKAAALATLTIGRIALEHNLILKDASAYNIQFVDGRPCLIDTLSFEAFDGRPVWKAYKQFCQHFLAPLALMAYADIRLNSLLRDHIDGIPLDMAAKLLPMRHRAKGGLAMHLWLHSAAQRRFASSTQAPSVATRQMSSQSAKTRLLGQIDSLERTVKNLKLPRRLSSEWGDYYTFTNYEEESQASKAGLVGDYITGLQPASVWDLGGNDGRYSRVALEAGAGEVVCFDIDPLAVDKNYRQITQEQVTRLMPVLLDLTNPSPGIGWANRERDSVAQRAPQGNVVMALALIHHLAISNNLPFELIAEYFASLGQYLVIEFVPKADSKVEVLLATREDIFPHYNQADFEAAFGRFYTITRQDQVAGSQRTLYLMKTRRD